MKEQQPHSIQSVTFSFPSVSASFLLTASPIANGVRWSGQVFAHLPQRMQGVGSGRIASRSLSATIALVVFITGKPASGTAIPIIGPP